MKNMFSNNSRASMAAPDSGNACNRHFFRANRFLMLAVQFLAGNAHRARWTMIACCGLFLGACEKPAPISTKTDTEASFIARTVATLQTEQQAALEGTQGPKSQMYARLHCMSAFARKLTAAERESLVRAVCKGSNEDDPSAPLREVADYLFEPLAEDGRPDLILLLLRDTSCSPWTIPLVSELHALGLAGKTAGGVQLLFDAYDSASPSRRASIEERIQHELAFYLRGTGFSGPQAVAWARSWYEMNKDRLLVSHGVADDGEWDCWSAPTLIETAPAIERLLATHLQSLLAGKCDYSQFDFVGEKPTCAISQSGTDGPTVDNFLSELKSDDYQARVLWAGPLVRCNSYWSVVDVRCELASRQGRSFLAYSFPVLVDHMSTRIVIRPN
ncbi:MAG: hypothetical protein JSR52_03900 [Planctomycetes bacterium]|nr:hypothetical protein [Planctomycetota bacterium]